MFCGQCGTQNADDARFCSNCGEVLNAAPAPEPVAPPKKSKKGLLFIIGGAVLAVALALILIFTLSGGRGARNPEALGKKYILHSSTLCVRVHAHLVVYNSVIPWTAAHQAPLFMGFSRQEHRRGLPFSPPRLKEQTIILNVCSKGRVGYNSCSERYF